jgi:CheY-like chemotaxis protein
MDGLAMATQAAGEPERYGRPVSILLSSLGTFMSPEVLDAARIKAVIPKPVRQYQLHDTIVAVLTGTERRVRSDEIAVPEAAKGTVDVSGLRVLLVEDNPVNMRIATMFLDKLGCSVETATNGLQALDTLTEHGQTFDVVLMDCQMPVMDGYQATAELRRREAAGHRVPIIALTAHAMQGDRERCLEAGMDDYLSKPIRPEELAAAVLRWLPLASPAGEPAR